jgi:hypothetical protein
MAAAIAVAITATIRPWPCSALLLLLLTQQGATAGADVGVIIKRTVDLFECLKQRDGGEKYGAYFGLLLDPDNLKRLSKRAFAGI